MRRGCITTKQSSKICGCEQTNNGVVSFVSHGFLERLKHSDVPKLICVVSFNKAILRLKFV
jgi:hypothetical protein